VSVTIQLAPAVQSTWTVSQVRATLLEHEEGSFASSALLWEAMGRDDRVEAVMETLTDGFVSLPFEVLISEEGDGRQRRAARDWFETAWPKISPEASYIEALGWLVGIGVAYGTIEYPDGLGGVPRRTVWHPQFLRWDPYRRGYYAQTENLGEVRVEAGDGKWWLLERRGSRSWMHGAVRSLAIPWLIRGFDWRDWARHNEAHGMPIRKAIVPEEASDPEKADFFASLRRLAQETTIMLPREQVGTAARGWDLELLELTEDGSRGFERLMSAVNTAIAVRILGQNLTTDAQGGGSYALGKVSAGGTSDRLQALAKVFETGDRAGISEPIAEARWGSREVAPWARFNGTPAADHQAEATAYVGLGKAIESLDAGLGRSGLQLDARVLAERFGLPVIDRPGGPTGLPPGGNPPEPNASRSAFDTRNRQQGPADAPPLEAAVA
jgi:phage gp29-like protein